MIDCTGMGFSNDIISGIDWALTHAASLGKRAVFTLAFSRGGIDFAVEAAMRDAYEQGHLLVVAGGNNNQQVLAQ